jgi:hypothetical protein
MGKKLLGASQRPPPLLCCLFHLIRSFQSHTSIFILKLHGFLNPPISLKKAQSVSEETHRLLEKIFVQFNVFEPMLMFTFKITNAFEQSERNSSLLTTIESNVLATIYYLCSDNAADLTK